MIEGGPVLGFFKLQRSGTNGSCVAPPGLERQATDYVTTGRGFREALEKRHRVIQGSRAFGFFKLQRSDLSMAAGPKQNPSSVGATETQMRFALGRTVSPLWGLGRFSFNFGYGQAAPVRPRLWRLKGRQRTMDHGCWTFSCDECLVFGSSTVVTDAGLQVGKSPVSTSQRIRGFWRGLQSGKAVSVTGEAE